MPITRTTWIDDDGTGAVGSIINNAWLQSLYNQIDAFAPAVSSLSLNDVSGASLGVLGTMLFCKSDRQVVFQVQVVYPATANAAAALIGFLPWKNSTLMPSSFSQGYGLQSYFYIGANQDYIAILNPTSSANRTNAQLSGATLAFAGSFITV